MALARVQASAVDHTSATGTNTISVATPPSVGNGLVVFINLWRPSPFSSVPSTCTDNQGNTYTLAGTRHVAGASPVTGIFYCPIVTATGSPFTLTALVAPNTSCYWVCQVIEFSGVGAGLTVDQVVGTTGSSTTPATGSTAALGGPEVLQAAAFAIAGTKSTITVAAATPTWTQEFEELPSTQIAGEANTRIVPSATGTTPSCSWTVNATGAWAALLVAFGPPGGGAAVERVQSYVWGPL